MQQMVLYFPAQELSEALTFMICSKIEAIFYVLKQPSFADLLSLWCPIIQT